MVVKHNSIAKLESLSSIWYLTQFGYNIMDMVFNSKSLITLKILFTLQLSAGKAPAKAIQLGQWCKYLGYIPFYQLQVSTDSIIDFLLLYWTVQPQAKSC
jgi:hypothetical protein